MNKKILLLPLAALCACLETAAAEEAAPEQCIVVAGNFGKNDTLHYTVTENSWVVSGKDTLQDCNYASYGRLTVKEKGRHKSVLIWTITDLAVNGRVQSLCQQGMLDMEGILKKQLVGQALEFTVDEMGRFKKWNNMEVLEQKIDRMNTVMTGEYMKLAGQDTANRHTNGMGLAVVHEAVYRNNLLGRQLWAIENLFGLHGQQFKLGEYAFHRDANNFDYSEDNTVSADFCGHAIPKYRINTETDFTPSDDDFTEFVSELFLTPIRSRLVVPIALHSVFDQQKRTGMKAKEKSSREYYLSGWPQKASFESTRTIGRLGKISQTSVRCLK